MTVRKCTALLSALVAAFGEERTVLPLPAGAHAAMHYPKLLPLLRFSVQGYAVPGWGNLFAMATQGMGGRMQLATLVCTPNLGGEIPFLLIDVMAGRKTLTAFVEYYDCTRAGALSAPMEQVAARWGDLPEYPEKPAWYRAQRAPYSLIKCGEDQDHLEQMLLDSVHAYASVPSVPGDRSAANLAGLKTFQTRMLQEGNPSSHILENVLGKAEAAAFFQTEIMPLAYRAEA